ncbi:MAG: GIY-YIG nuclease family protein [Acidobacteria bacterium]|nr:GIY-YIG nuclease family protein [Acidobacteriota bacterium]
MYFVYVLRSQTNGKLYTGQAKFPVQRLGQHNQGVSKSTRGRGPWEIVYQENYATRLEAIRRERYLKSGKGREELKRILETKAELDKAG